MEVCMDDVLYKNLVTFNSYRESCSSYKESCSTEDKAISSIFKIVPDPISNGRKSNAKSKLDDLDTTEFFDEVFNKDILKYVSKENGGHKENSVISSNKSFYENGSIIEIQVPFPEEEYDDGIIMPLESSNIRDIKLTQRRGYLPKLNQISSNAMIVFDADESSDEAFSDFSIDHLDSKSDNFIFDLKIAKEDDFRKAGYYKPNENAKCTRSVLANLKPCSCDHGIVCPSMEQKQICRTLSLPSMTLPETSSSDLTNSNPLNDAMFVFDDNDSFSEGFSKFSSHRLISEIDNTQYNRKTLKECGFQRVGDYKSIKNIKYTRSVFANPEPCCADHDIACPTTEYTHMYETFQLPSMALSATNSRDPYPQHKVTDESVLLDSNFCKSLNELVSKLENWTKKALDVALSKSDTFKFTDIGDHFEKDFRYASSVLSQIKNYVYVWIREAYKLVDPHTKLLVGKKRNRVYEELVNSGVTLCRTADAMELRATQDCKILKSISDHTSKLDDEACKEIELTNNPNSIISNSYIIMARNLILLRAETDDFSNKISYFFLGKDKVS